ncbi:hypothetical protein RJ639_038785 [Escallonia herrerae]|uniref:Uncharacterized protein n=1 Tax=Escallonia herrerae TaxID=1293975 RepID=A0AA89B5P8_9ASTE|nr:hypothetical protein RJ639_038785 [Escallonia herrerae]
MLGKTNNGSYLQILVIPINGVLCSLHSYEADGKTFRVRPAIRYVSFECQKLGNIICVSCDETFFWSLELIAKRVTLKVTAGDAEILLEGEWMNLLEEGRIHCPSFICFCKPSAAHLYTPGPLKLENTPHVPSSVVSVTDTSNHFSGEAIEFKEGNLDDEKKQHAEIALRSCIRKVSSELSAPNEVQRKRVQWVDKLGKELVEIKEFESSETGDTDNEENNRGSLFSLRKRLSDHNSILGIIEKLRQSNISRLDYSYSLPLDHRDSNQEFFSYDIENSTMEWLSSRTLICSTFFFVGCWDLVVVVLEQDRWSLNSIEDVNISRLLLKNMNMSKIDDKFSGVPIIPTRNMNCRGTFEDAVARYIENSKVRGIMILLASPVYSGNSRKKLFRGKERTDKGKVFGKFPSSLLMLKSRKSSLFYVDISSKISPARPQDLRQFAKCTHGYNLRIVTPSQAIFSKKQILQRLYME